jgi:hypothetical protein
VSLLRLKAAKQAPRSLWEAITSWACLTWIPVWFQPRRSRIVFGEIGLHDVNQAAQSMNAWRSPDSYWPALLSYFGYS